MKRLGTLIAVLSILGATILLAQRATASSAAGDAINTTCPIAGEAIDGETSIEYDGHTIGFCCGGCDSKFLAWPQEQRDSFVRTALAEQEAVAEEVAQKPAPRVDAYTVTTCPVSGKALGSMGDPIVVQVEGREVRLCCQGCVGRVEADPAGTVAKVDAAFAAQQRAYYPLTTCVISGESLEEEGVDIGVDVVVGNRLIRVCCDTCAAKVRRDPSPYHRTLDAAVIEAQGSHYPLSDCIVREGSALGSMGDPAEIVVGNRLVRFCCGGCRPAFDAEPAKFVARLDAAWTAAHAEHAEGHGEDDEHSGHRH